MSLASETYNLIILASGGGTNAENIIKYFKANSNINVARVWTNNPAAGVIDRCKNLDVPCGILSPNTCKDGDRLLDLLKKDQPSLIILAGYLKLIPKTVVEHYKNRIINIHPALLPAYGGKGMYGENVHQAVIENGESESGITIHYVNERYDEGELIIQESVAIEQGETTTSLAKKIHELEMKWFPIAIERVLEALRD